MPPIFVKVAQIKFDVNDDLSTNIKNFIDGLSALAIITIFQYLTSNTGQIIGGTYAPVLNLVVIYT